MKKIIHVLHSVGGVDVYLRLLTENISNDFEIVIIHQKDINKKPYVNRTGKTIKEYYIPIVRQISIINDILSIVKTVKIIKLEKPDLIHCHSAKGGVIARIASFFYPVTVLHTPHAYSYLCTLSVFKRWFFLKIETILSKSNSILVATSNSEQLRGIKDVGYLPEKTIVIQNSIIDQKKTVNLDKLDLPKHYICSVGRPSYQKNIDDMIDVVSELKKIKKDICLVLMGIGEYSPDTDSIKKKIIELNLEKNVIMIEWIEREKILSIIKNSELYISTSRYEGLPYSVIEALSCSKPCVLMDCDGNRDLVLDKENGYLIPQGDVLKMSESVVRILFDKSLKTKLGNKSLELFKLNNDLNVNMLKLETVYRKYSTKN